MNAIARHHNAEQGGHAVLSEHKIELQTLAAMSARANAVRRSATRGMTGVVSFGRPHSVRRLSAARR